MKRILITGANKGIGLATVKKLLESYSDTYVLLGSRDLSRGQHTLNELVNSNQQWIRHCKQRRNWKQNIRNE